MGTLLTPDWETTHGNGMQPVGATGESELCAGSEKYSSGH